MKAMVLRAFGDIRENPLVLSAIPRPEPGPGEVLIKINYCGVCHTDLHTVEGELPEVRLPIVPGHQVVGIVEEPGEGATRFKPGDRVGAAWLYSTCGHCRFCLSGRENLCETARFTGYHANGGYAEHIVVPERFAYPIPGVFRDEEAAPLLCAGIIGYRALKLSGLKPGGRLGLFGFGASAHVAIQVARHWGSDVYVFSRSEEHRALALKLGAAWAGRAEDEPSAKLESAIIFAPAGGLVPEALLKLDRGGTLALAGIFMSPIPELDYGKYIYQERTLRSVANATRKDGEELLQIAAQIPIRTTTQIFSLEEANRVLGLLKAGRISGAAVLRVSG
jgi:alcohol dehydrogenase, propanol-preferring